MIVPSSPDRRGPIANHPRFPYRTSVTPSSLNYHVFRLLSFNCADLKVVFRYPLLPDYAAATCELSTVPDASSSFVGASVIQVFGEERVSGLYLRLRRTSRLSVN